MNKPFQDTKKRWWYVSETRKHGRNKLWCGPFQTLEQALADQQLKEN